MHLSIYTDGGSQNNPGNAAISFVIYGDGKLLSQYSKKIGIATNNVAEYTALISALDHVKNMDLPRIEEIRCFSDSQLMVRQLNGEYKIKNLPIKLLAEQVKKIEVFFKKPVKYVHVPREQNQLADSLVKKEFV